MREHVRDLVAWLAEVYHPQRVLEIGSFRVEGQEELADLRPFFPKSLFLGLDLRAGPGVDVRGDAHMLPFKDASIDLILCIDTLEHVLDPWRAVAEMKRVLNPAGLLLLVSVMRFPIHDYPWDFWRFTPEIFQKFGEHIGKGVVFYHGDILEPDTVVLLASPAGRIPEKPPTYVGGRPLLRYGEENQCAEEILSFPYLPRFASAKYLLSPDTSWGLAVELVPEGSEVLDLGCGPGFMGAVLSRFKGCRVWGVEINPTAAARARALYQEVLEVDLEKVALSTCFPEKRFDVVCFLEVLEHLRDPLKVLREAREVLKPEGFVVISIPNVAHASLVAELIRGRFDYRPWGLLDETHLRFFTREGLERLLEAAGFRLETLRRVVLAPEATEFGAASWNDLPAEVRDFIRFHNPEHLTYQFVVRAVPHSAPSSPLSPDRSLYTLLGARIKELEQACAERDRVIHDLLASRSWRLTAPLRRVSTLARKLKGRIWSR